MIIKNEIVDFTDDEALALWKSEKDKMKPKTIEYSMPLAHLFLMLKSPKSDSTEEIDDLYQILSIGLIKAIRRYKPTKGARMSSWIWTYMGYELAMHNRKKRDKINRAMKNGISFVLMADLETEVISSI